MGNSQRRTDLSLYHNWSQDDLKIWLSWIDDNLCPMVSRFSTRKGLKNLITWKKLR